MKTWLMGWGMVLGCVAGAAMGAPGSRMGGQATGDQPSGYTRDPFTTSERMYAEAGRQATNSASGGRGFIPMGFEQTPRMKLRGFVNNQQSVGILEIEGVGTYLVRKGDEIGLQAIGKNTVIKVVDVSAQGVKVQTGLINQIIVVR